MRFKRNIYVLYWVIFFQSLIPAYAVERLFWAERGMTIEMVVACEVIYAAVIILLEVPSGVLADLLGRKALIIAGAVLTCSEFLLLLLADSFWHFALAVLLTGIGSAATSGAWNALLYDSLEAMGQSAAFERHVGRIHTLDAVACIAVGILGGLTAQWFGYSFNYLVSLGCCVLSLAGTFFLLEPPRVMATGERATIRGILKTAGAFFKKRPDVLLVVLHATVIAAFIIYVDEFWQLYMQAIGFPVALFGVVMAAFAGMRMAGALGAERLKRWPRIAPVMLVLSAITAGCLAVAMLAKSLVGLAAMLLACCASEMMQVLSAGYLHHRADSAARATIESIGSLLQRVFAIGLGVVFAFVAGRVSLFDGYGALAALCVVCTACMAGMYRRLRGIGVD